MILSYLATGLTIAFTLLVVVIAFTWVISTLSLAPWVPSYRRDLKRLLTLLDLNPDTTIMDLGCGTGTIVRYLSKHSPAQCYGVELNLGLYLFAKLRGKLLGWQNYHIQFGNLYNVPLSQFDYIYLFGLPKSLSKKLEKKFRQELKPGALVVSFAFAFDGIKPILHDKPGKKDTSIRIYRFN